MGVHDSLRAWLRESGEACGQYQLGTARAIAALQFSHIFHDPAGLQFNSRRVGGDATEQAIAGLAPVAAICGAARQAQVPPPILLVSSQLGRCAALHQPLPADALFTLSKTR